MRNKKHSIRIKKFLSATLAFVLAFQVSGSTVKADNDDGVVVVVSFGDSYSSGEAIGVGETLANGEKGRFYGYTGDVNNDYNNDDWIAHRSMMSWPSRLEIPGVPGKLGDYHYPDVKGAVCEWYFVASSGAETKDIIKEGQEKRVRTKSGFDQKRNLPKQIDVFNKIDKPVDYVTMTIGGNDVGFADILTLAALEPLKIKPWLLEHKFNKLWKNINKYKADLTATYEQIAAAAPEAQIFVAGYPKLLAPKGSKFFFSSKQAKLVNENVTRFNDEVLSKLVGKAGKNFHFVDVEKAFDGHGAYAKDAYINGIIFKKQEDDIDKKAATSAYSFHPNDSGVQAYADCVNAAIKQYAKEQSMAVADYRIVLKWGENPSDLDSHVEGVLQDGTPFHACFNEQTIKDGDKDVCNLDVDKMMRNGPETIALTTSTDKPYYYYVYRYRGAGKLQTSDAVVEVYKGDVLEKTFTVPSGAGDGDYWNVFAIVGGKIIEGKTITDEADTKYANE